MLILSRRVNETILIPELDISFEVRQIKGKAIRVGVKAPAEINVIRGELLAHAPSSQPLPQSFVTTRSTDTVVGGQDNTLTHTLLDAIASAQTSLAEGNAELAAEQLRSALENSQPPQTAQSHSVEPNAAVLEPLPVACY